MPPPSAPRGGRRTRAASTEPGTARRGRGSCATAARWRFCPPDWSRHWEPSRRSPPAPRFLLLRRLRYPRSAGSSFVSVHSARRPWSSFSVLVEIVGDRLRLGLRDAEVRHQRL